MKPGAKDLLCIALLLVLVAATFPPGAFDPSNLLATRFSDAITQYLPHQSFVRQSLLAHHRFPFWDPYECAGTPAFPNPLYPALSFPSALLIPLPAALALNLGFFIHLFMAGGFAFALSRQAGCSRAASLFAGLLYALGARGLTHAQAGLYSRLVMYAYLPLLLYCAERCFREPSVKSAAGLAGVLSLALLSGEVQLFVYALAGIAAYTALRARIVPHGMPAIASRRRSWVCLLSGALLFVPLSAFYLLPAHRLYPLLSRSHTLGQGRFDFMPSLGEFAAALLSPALIGEFSSLGTLPWECALYVGVAPLLLLFRGARDRDARRDFALWGLLAAATVLFSVRECSPLHAALDRFLPVLGRFRNPGRMLYLTSLFLAILAARLFDGVAAERKARLGKGGARNWLLILVCGTLAYGFLITRVRGASSATLAQHYADRFAQYFGAARACALDSERLRFGASLSRQKALDSLLFTLLLIPLPCFLCALRERGHIRRRTFSFSFCALSFLELLRCSGAFLEVHPLGELYPSSPLTTAVRNEAGGGRMLDMTSPPHAAFWTAYPFARSAALGIPRVDGYTPVNFTAYARFLDLMTGSPGSLPRWSLVAPAVRAPVLLSLLGTGLVLSNRPPGIPGFRSAGEFIDVPVYRQFLGGEIVPRLFLSRHPDRPPRAWLVSRAEVCPPGEEARALPILDQYTKALVAPGARPLSAAGAFKPLAVQREAPGWLELEVRTGHPVYLCTREIWAPGWEAIACDTSVKVTRTNGIFCGIYLPRGEHAVRLRYIPSGMRPGAMVSLITLACLVASIRTVRRTRAPLPPPSW